MKFITEALDLEFPGRPAADTYVAFARLSVSSSTAASPSFPLSWLAATVAKTTLAVTFGPSNHE